MIDEEELIELVKQHPVLYDTRHVNYMNTTIKKDIWCKIAKELNCKNGEEIKSTWLKLRGSFRDARRRHLKCIKAGMSPMQVKVWRHQNRMSFLESYMSAGLREGFIENCQYLAEIPKNDNASDSSVRSEIDEQSQMFTEDPLCEDKEKSDVEEQACTSYEDDTKITNQSEKFSINQPKKRKRHSKELSELLTQSIQQREERARQRADDRKKLMRENRTVDDPLYHFFISMYQLTKNMPAQYQHRIRSQVFQTVSDAEEDILQITYTNTLPSMTDDNDQQLHAQETETIEIGYKCDN